MSQKLFDRKELIGLMCDLDKELKDPLQIRICGGAAAMLFHNLGGRQTIDIDVLDANPNLASVRDEIERVAKKHDCQLSWINVDVERGDHLLPRGFEQRLIDLDEGFDKLSCKGLSKVDLVLTKLSVVKVRQRDIEDVESLRLTSQERELVQNHIKEIRLHDPDRAHEMLRRFNRLSVSIESAEDHPSREAVTNARDLFKYAEQVRNVHLDETVKAMMREDLASGEQTIKDLLLLIDGIAYEREKLQKRKANHGMDI